MPPRGRGHVWATTVCAEAGRLTAAGGPSRAYAHVVRRATLGARMETTGVLWQPALERSVVPFRVLLLVCARVVELLRVQPLGLPAEAVAGVCHPWLRRHDPHAASQMRRAARHRPQ